METLPYALVNKRTKEVYYVLQFTGYHYLVQRLDSFLVEPIHINDLPYFDIIDNTEAAKVLYGPRNKN